MSCRYKDECPSYSGWCDGPKQDFSKCVEFLITAYENEKKKNDHPKLDDVNLIFFANYIHKLEAEDLLEFGCDENDNAYNVAKILIDYFGLKDRLNL